MSVDGTDQQRVTDNPSADSDPAWSPGGEWLAFVSQRDGNDEIYIVKADSSGPYLLTDNGAQNWSPAWQPPGESIPSPGPWARIFEGDNYGAFLEVILTPDGNILAVGATNHLHMPPYSGDALVMKLTLAGEVLWEQAWGGEGYEQADSVVLTGDGGYFIFGETDSYGAGNRDFFTSENCRGWY